MVTIKLDKYAADYARGIQVLRELGVSDEEIQKKYDEEVRRREDAKTDDV